MDFNSFIKKTYEVFFYAFIDKPYYGEWFQRFDDIEYFHQERYIDGIMSYTTYVYDCLHLKVVDKLEGKIFINDHLRQDMFSFSRVRTLDKVRRDTRVVQTVEFLKSVGYSKELAEYGL